MENTLRGVALLNSKGIHALVMGRKNHLSRALSSFQEALGLLEQIQQQQKVGDRHDDAKASIKRPGQVTESCLEAFVSSPVARLDSSAFYVYDRTLFFKPLSDTSVVGIAFYTAILHFNMALARHIKIMASSDNINNKKRIKFATRSYKQCLKTLKRAGAYGGRPPIPGGGEAMIYLRLAALNNLAHVQQVAGQYDKVRETLARAFKYSVAQRPTLFRRNNESAPRRHAFWRDCAFHSDEVRNDSSRPSGMTMNAAFVNEVLLNVMVTGPVDAAGAA